MNWLRFAGYFLAGFGGSGMLFAYLASRPIDPLDAVFLAVGLVIMVLSRK